MPEGEDNALVIENDGQTTATAAPAVLTQEQQDFNRNMAFAFDEKPPLVTTDNSNQNANIDTTTTVTATDNNTTQTQSPVFEFKTFTDKFGYENPDAAIKEIEELREFKSKPPVQEQQYENEESKKLHQLFLAGKIEDAVEIITTQKRIEFLTSAEVTDANADDIIKLNMQLKYKDAGLTPKEIDYKYNKQYSLPKEPVLDVDDSESVAAHNEWKEKVEDINTGKIIDAKAAKIDLQSAKTKLVLPNIDDNVDQDYEAYKASNAKANESHATIITPAMNSLKESDVPLSFKVEDANNQMNFDVALVPTKEDFDKARQDSLSLQGFLSKTCYDKDGKFIPTQLQRMILLTQNFDNYAQSIARQAVNAERARVVAKETVGNGNTGKDFNVNTDKSELQKNMEFALS